MKTEDNLRAAIREYTESIRPDGSAWERIQTGMTERPERSWRPVAVGFLAAAALMALVAVRMLADNDGRIELLDPTPHPTATDQTVQRLQEPTRGHGTVDGDEAWYINFPNAWSLSPWAETDPSVEGWNIRNFGSDGGTQQVHPDGPEATISIVFEVGPPNPGGYYGKDGSVRPPPSSVDDLFESMCRDHAPYPSEVHVVSCVDASIDGRTWVREVVDAPGERRIMLATFANSKIYTLTATLPGDGNHDDRTYIVYQVANTVTIEEPGS